MTRLRTLAPRVRTLNNSVRTLSQLPDTRLRGSGLQDRNKLILARYPMCAICEAQDRVSVAREVDHRLPLVDGGADHESNLWGLCVACHAAKTTEEATRRAAGLPMPLPRLPPLKAPRAPVLA